MVHYWFYLPPQAWGQHAQNPSCENHQLSLLPWCLFYGTRSRGFFVTWTVNASNRQFSNQTHRRRVLINVGWSQIRSENVIVCQITLPTAPVLPKCTALRTQKLPTIIQIQNSMHYVTVLKFSSSSWSHWFLCGVLLTFIGELILVNLSLIC